MIIAKLTLKIGVKKNNYNYFDFGGIFDCWKIMSLHVCSFIQLVNTEIRTIDVWLDIFFEKRWKINYDICFLFENIRQQWVIVSCTVSKGQRFVKCFLLSADGILSKPTDFLPIRTNLGGYHLKPFGRFSEVY